jgi:DNA primase
MSIPDEDVALVRTSTDIVALIGEHTALRQQGRRWSGLCPFHTEKTPSFSVNAAEGLYYCFGCQASGDAISFVRAMEHLDFADAVRWLADRAGVTLHEDAEGGADHKRRAELFEAMERAVTWYHERLLTSPDAGRARDYLRSRGYDGAIVRQFRLGWAPDDWDVLCRQLALSERVLSGAGLGFVNRRGRLQDSFRARVIFPICDPSGRPVALGGRILPAGTGGGASTGGAHDDGGSAGRSARGPEPKYKNSQETAIYAKRRVLYALNWAKHDVIARGEVVVCEGYTDVIGCFQAGVTRAVATCGTALAEEHFTLLRSFASRIVLAYDADTAGQSATSRVYEWERRHEVEVAVAALPGGSDPGELARTDPEALVRAVAEARPFLQFRVDRVFAAGELSSVEGRARAAEAALVAVAEHPDELVRDQYVMQVADRCRLDPALLRERLEAQRRRGPSPASSRGATGRPAGGRGSTGHGPSGRGSEGVTAGDGGRSGSGATRGTGSAEASHSSGDPGVDVDSYADAVDDAWDGGGPADRARRASTSRGGARPGPGVEALRLAVHRPAEVADRLDELLFEDPLQRRAFLTLSEAESLHEAIEGAAPDVADLLRRITVEEPVITVDGLADPVDAVVFQLVLAAAHRALGELGAEIRAGAGDRPDLLAEHTKVRLWMDDLAGDGGHAAADRLVAWLRSRAEEG